MSGTMARAGHLGATFVRAVLALAVLAACAPACAFASFPGGNGVIAYTSEGAIWAVDPVIGTQLQLTTGPGDAMPSFSASGDWLAFQRTVGTSSTVFVARADGSDPKPLTSGSEPAFSPDGRRIVFVRPTGLFVTGVTPGSPVRRLTDRPGDGEPRWGSRGTIVFERVHVRHVSFDGAIKNQVTNELDTIDPPSAHVHTLLTYEQLGGYPSEVETEMHPDWSPRSTKIVAALCNFRASSGSPFHTVPALVFHTDCSPDVWAPDGAGLAEPKVGALSGRPSTSCPHVVGDETEISWQPLHPGTLRVPTVTCEPRPPEREVVVIPLIVERGSRTCYYDRHRHRRRCFTS